MHVLDFSGRRYRKLEHSNAENSSMSAVGDDRELWTAIDAAQMPVTAGVGNSAGAGGSAEAAAEQPAAKRSRGEC